MIEKVLVKKNPDSADPKFDFQAFIKNVQALERIVSAISIKC